MAEEKNVFFKSLTAQLFCRTFLTTNFDSLIDFGIVYVEQRRPFLGNMGGWQQAVVG